MAATVQAALNSDALREEAKALVKRQPGRFKHVGWRKVPVRFSGGATIPLRVAYYARNCDLAKGKKGLTPGLLLLGVHDRCTPLLASQVSLASAALCSLEEAKHMLGNQGCHLDIKTIRNMTKRFACRARLAQEQGNDLPTLENAAVKGRRVVVSVDGGRIRIRKKKRGPKTAKGRSRYKTDWKEPKLLIVYVVNDERRQDKKFCPLIDGTPDGPDALFGLLAYYLEKLGITAADKLLFVADGALWIWDHVIPVLTSVSSNPKMSQNLQYKNVPIK